MERHTDILESMIQWDEIEQYVANLDLLFENLRPDQITTLDEYTTRLRNRLTYYGLDLQDVNTVATILFTVYTLADQAEKVSYTEFQNNPIVGQFLDLWAENIGLLARDILKNNHYKE